MAAHKSLRIPVRTKHLLQGKCKSPQKCVLKLAFNDRLAAIYPARSGWFVRSSVKGNGATITLRNRLTGEARKDVYHLPDAAYKRVCAFDLLEEELKAFKNDEEGREAFLASKGLRPFSFHADLVTSKPTKFGSPKELAEKREKEAMRRRKYGGGRTSDHQRWASVLTQGVVRRVAEGVGHRVEII
jgi:hypothetical protein